MRKPGRWESEKDHIYADIYDDLLTMNGDDDE